jgi:hypothetical protein
MFFDRFNHKRTRGIARQVLATCVGVLASLSLAGVTPAAAQQPPQVGNWQSGVQVAPATMPTPAGAGSTSVARTGGEAPPSPSALPQVKLEALLTNDGQRIDQGLVWRVFNARSETDGKPKLLATHREAAPLLKVQPGDYTINVAFGRANLTRKITVKANDAATEQFVLNAGGLRLSADVGGSAPPANAITYSIQAEERDQFGARATVMSGAKPGSIIRLNAGIYQIVSTYGDANAVVRADVTVEAGKLTEAAISHAAAKVQFKLVTQAGGDAVADTAWSVQTLNGELVKESVGMMPSHILAPGSYAAFAKREGKAYRRDFSVRPGDNVQVEIVMAQ